VQIEGIAEKIVIQTFLSLYILSLRLKFLHLKKAAGTAFPFLMPTAVKIKINIW
jgi:hypothetical protein